MSPLSALAHERPEPVIYRRCAACRAPAPVAFCPACVRTVCPACLRLGGCLARDCTPFRVDLVSPVEEFCPRGHRRTAENTRRVGRYRRCRDCQRVPHARGLRLERTSKLLAMRPRA